MNRETEPVAWPPEAGDPQDLPLEIEPPPQLVEAVVGALHDRELLRAEGRSSTWRSTLLAAACAVVAFGVGRFTAPDHPAAPVLDGTATDVWAVLLYENEAYDRPEGAEVGERYREYGSWVAEARRRGQWITGQDLEAEAGWRLFAGGSGDAGGVVEPVPTVGERDAPLSGIFLLHAATPEEALSLAHELPHLRHGGVVVVQRTLPTAAPPSP